LTDRTHDNNYYILSNQIYGEWLNRATALIIFQCVNLISINITFLLSDKVESKGTDLDQPAVPNTQWLSNVSFSTQALAAVQRSFSP
jgi:hypothetical protein